MASNKNATIRYRVLDRCLSNHGRYYTIDDLIEECNIALQEDNPDTTGISRRTIFNDIKYMESEQGWSIPLERIKKGKTTYYRYLDRKFSIYNCPLNQTEVYQLKEALMVFKRIKGMPQFEWVELIIVRLMKELAIKEGLPDVMRFESNIFLKGLEHLSNLYNSIIYKKVLLMKYQPFFEPSVLTFTFYPYFLNEYNNRWFVMGYSNKHKKVITLALDRIVNFETQNKKYKEYTGTPFYELLEDIIGVTIPDNTTIQKYKLWFSPQRAPYILTKPLHGSMKIIKNDETGLQVSIEVIPNKELSALIYSFGNDVEVLEGDLNINY